MPISKTWPSGGTNPTPTTYQIPLNTELNWTTLTTFLQALADSAQGTSFQKFAMRRAIASPVAVVATTDCMVVTDLTVAGAVTVNLPAGADKQLYFIFDGKGDAATNNITINRAGADTIRGATSIVIDRNYGGVILSYNAASTDWKAFGPFITPGGVIPADFVGILPTTKGGTGVNGTAVFPGSGTVAIYPISLTAAVTGTLPVANGGTGITSLGAGVATWLGTPSSANLASALTDETGTGAAVFANTPTLVAPVLGTPTSGVATNLTGLPLSTGVTGTLPIANGGTGQTTAILAFNALSPNTTKGDLVGHNGTNNVRVAIGTNGTVLTADSTQTAGINWTTPLTNPMTTQGDIIYGNVGGAAVRLAAGTAGKYLQTNGVAAPAWSSVGILPLGSVIATFPTLGGAAYTTAATTTPDANGFVLCQGQTLVSGAMSGLVVPNINAQVFLRGNSTSGTTAVGTSTQTLIAANIPSLTSTGTTTTTGTTVANTTGANSVNHTHTWSGTTGNNNSSLNHDHAYNLLTYAQDAAAGGARFAISGFSAVATGGNFQSLDHTHNYSGTTSGDSPNHTHSIPSLTVNSGMGVSVTTTGTSGSSFAIEPKYINAVYLMRVN